MTPIYVIFSSLVRYPWMALAVAAVLALGANRFGRLSAWLAAAAWLCYGLYEMGMQSRLLCSGECNIRFDLVLIYPVLLVLTIVALLSLWGGSPRDRRA